MALSKIRGFTLIELLISVSIFVFMTALLVAKYGNFNQSVLLTNLAYDVALTLRTAQTYGLSVQGQTGQFQYAYGVDFCELPDATSPSLNCPRPSIDAANNQVITMFADVNRNGGYDNGDFAVSTYSIKRGAKILGFCTSVIGSSCTGTGGVDNNLKRVHVSFSRPDPDAIICPKKSGDSSNCLKTTPRTDRDEKKKDYLKIVLQSSDGNTRSIIVRQSGQISVED